MSQLDTLANRIECTGEVAALMARYFGRARAPTPQKSILTVRWAMHWSGFDALLEKAYWLKRRLYPTDGFVPIHGGTLDSAYRHVTRISGDEMETLVRPWLEVWVNEYTRRGVSHPQMCRDELSGPLDSEIVQAILEKDLRGVRYIDLLGDKGEDENTSRRLTLSSDETGILVADAVRAAPRQSLASVAPTIETLQAKAKERAAQEAVRAAQRAAREEALATMLEAVDGAELALPEMLRHDLAVSKEGWGTWA